MEIGVFEVIRGIVAVQCAVELDLRFPAGRDTYQGMGWGRRKLPLLGALICVHHYGCVAETATERERESERE